MAGSRGVSPVIGTVLLIALAGLLATGVLGAGMAMETLATTPSVVVDHGDLVAGCAGCDPDDQVVRVRHVTGDAVPVSEVSVVVAAPNRTARLVDLPLAGNCLGDAHVAGPDIFDGRCGRVSGSLTGVAPDEDGTWDAGDELVFRLRKSAVRLAPGDDLTVRVVHDHSGGTVAETTLTAGE